MDGDQEGEQASEPTAAGPVRMTISAVLGRGSSPERGLSPVHSLTATAADGRTLRIGRRDEGAKPLVAAQPLAFARYQRFDRCPICLEPSPGSREHVPPEPLGGSIMTLTCLRCNNEFGSKLETHLLDWYEDAASARFANEAVRGARRSPRILFRETDTGQFVLLPDRGRLDPAIVDMLSSGSFHLIYEPPEPRLVYRAALKSAYLAACVLLRQIPFTVRAQAIRRELMEARDLPRTERRDLGEIARSLNLSRRHGPAVPGEVMLVVAHRSDGSPAELAISLARTLLVSWPLETPTLIRQAVPEAGDERDKPT